MRHNVFNSETNTPTILVTENPYFFSRQANRFPKDGILVPAGNKTPSFFTNKENANKAITRTKDYLRLLGIKGAKLVAKATAEKEVVVPLSDRLAEVEEVLKGKIKINKKSIVIDYNKMMEICPKKFPTFSLGTLAAFYAKATERKFKIADKPSKAKLAEISKAANVGKFNH